MIFFSLMFCIVFICFFYWRLSRNFQILQESIFLLAMATDRLEKELGTSIKAEEEVNLYMRTKFGDEAEKVSAEFYDSPLNKKLEILLAAQADIHRGVAKIVRPNNWLDGYLITKSSDEMEENVRDDNEDSPWFEGIKNLADTDLDGLLYLRPRNEED